MHLGLQRPTMAEYSAASECRIPGSVTIDSFSGDYSAFVFTLFVQMEVLHS